MGVFLPEPFLRNPEFRMFASDQTSHKDYVIRNDRKRNRLIFIDLDKPRVKPIAVEYVRYTNHALAHCPNDHSPIETIYSFDRKIVGPAAALELIRLKSLETIFAKGLARLLGSDGHGPSRGEARERLLRSLSEGPYSADPRVQRLLEKAAERASRRRYRVTPREAKDADPLSTASGLGRYEGAPSTPSEPLVWAAFEAAVVRHAEATTNDPTAHCAPLPGSIGRGVLEDHPRLDLRTLAQAGYLQPGQRRRGAIDWSGHSPLIDGLRFIVDLTLDQPPHLWLETMRGGEPRYQRLSLVLKDQAGRQRWSFICPQTGSASEVLAYRYGRFASARAQRLVHRSQFNKPRSGAAASASKAAS